METFPSVPFPLPLSQPKLSWIIFCILHWHCEHEQQHSTFSRVCIKSCSFESAHDGEGLNRRENAILQVSKLCFVLRASEKGEKLWKILERGEVKQFFNNFNSSQQASSAHHQLESLRISHLNTRSHSWATDDDVNGGKCEGNVNFVQNDDDDSTWTWAREIWNN